TRRNRRHCETAAAPDTGHGIAGAELRDHIATDSQDICASPWSIVADAQVIAARRLNRVAETVFLGLPIVHQQGRDAISGEQRERGIVKRRTSDIDIRIQLRSSTQVDRKEIDIPFPAY